LKPKEANMLKITVTETPTERKWVLAGRLVGPWVKELRATWKRAVTTHAGQACTIDLNEVTFVDKDGERLLRALSRKGVQLVGDGLYTKHILGRLRTPSKRNLPTLLAWLLVALLAHATKPGIYSGTGHKRATTNVNQALSVGVRPMNISSLSKAHFPNDRFLI
jgi:hypothetical protein